MMMYVIISWYVMILYVTADDDAVEDHVCDSMHTSLQVASTLRKTANRLQDKMAALHHLTSVDKHNIEKRQMGQVCMYT
jgi:hypothetical protein